VVFRTGSLTSASASQFEYRLCTASGWLGVEAAENQAAGTLVLVQHQQECEGNTCTLVNLWQTWRVIRGRVVEGGQLPRWISFLARRRCCHPSTVSFLLHVCSLPGGGWGELL
jgi:hypothetical protein